MIPVSSDFKTQIKKAGRQLNNYIDLDGSKIYGSDDLLSLKISSSSDLCKSVMRYAEAIYFNSHDYLDKYVHLGLGVVLVDHSTEYLDYGSFKVILPITYDKAANTTKIVMYDKMYEAQKLLNLEPIYDIVYPCTVLDLLEAICTKLDWTLVTTTFPNSDFPIGSDLLSGQKLTYRNVLDMIAEAAGSIILFNNDDELIVKTVDDSVLESLDSNTLISLKIEQQYGPINTIVLSREPQEDNIVQNS